MARKKSDEQKLKEGAGTGRSHEYIPWIKVHEFGSKGRVHRILGWKTRRIHQLLSDLELDYFLNVQWEDNVIDIREQFPLLPIEDTILIAENIGVRHPALNNKKGKEVVMTTDFLITVNTGGVVKDIVRTIKFNQELTKQRVIDKFKIEKEYFKRKGYDDWGIVTEQFINKIKSRNIYAIYDAYFWDEQIHLQGRELRKIIYKFLSLLVQFNFDILKTTNEFDRIMDWERGEGLLFFKYLITKKIIYTDMDVPFNFNIMKVWLSEEENQYEIFGK
ncbi:TnsA endonuclease N-terminal domain-containing protein [Clostridium saccharoperbutylacetonicum]|uniref:TnsA endonuclease N-terminal domain-containing protein n=1 Tax=Clostridium saccharoperbutylacetonicum TaxID=36745 RepID=UPI0039EB8CE2